jgi:site-specific recombinase XerD
MTIEILPEHEEARPSLRELFGLYKTSVQFNSGSSRQAYLSDVAKLVKFAEERGQLQADVTTIQDHLGNLTQSSARRSVHAIRHFFNWLIETERLKPEEKPAISTENIAKSKRYKQISTLSDNEIEKLLEQASSKPCDLALLTIAVKTGAKSREILSLTKGQISIEDPQAVKIRFIRDDKDKGRVVQLDVKSSEVVSSYLGTLTKSGQYIFSDPKSDCDQPLSRNAILLLLKPYRLALGRDDLTLSTLRYTYAANLDLGNIAAISETLGIKINNTYGLAKELRAKLAQTPQIPEP